MACKTAWVSWVGVGLVALGACASEQADVASAEVARAQEVVASERVDAPTEARRGGVSQTPPETLDPDLECYRFTAYASAAQREEKYSVPTIPDYYVGFNIKAPWKGKRYIKSFRSLIDNTKVLHHWLLYRQLNGGEETVLEGVRGTHPDGELLYGWAPGTDDAYFDADVGMEIDEGATFQLETHYNNTGSGPALDGSGVEVCVTPHRPTHVASFSWVGTDRINGVTATGTCTPETKEPIHLILAIPHMHLKGVHMKVDLTRAATGAVESVHDAAFDFEYQRSYLFDGLVLQPGDKLTTTCTYASPAKFGPGTNDEMCYFFSIAYPSGALARNNFFSSLHGLNTCIDL